MNANHTPEPWKIRGPISISGWVDIIGPDYPFDRNPVAYVVPAHPVDRRDKETEANAERIVACVNACDGIEDPAELRRQRDELLEALQTMLDVWPNTENKPGWCKRWSEAQEQARAAIENATKGTK